MAHVSPPRAADYDVIVAGGGMAGTAAAIGLAPGHLARVGMSATGSTEIRSSSG